MELSSCQHGFQHVARIHGSVCLASAYDGVQLIDKKDDPPVTVLHFFQHCLQPFLEFTPVLGSRHQGSHVQGEDGLLLQSFRHVPPDDPLGQAFYHGSLAHARLADEHRVVFSLPGQDPDHIPDLCVPADHRIQLLIPGPLHQVGTIFIQSIIGILRVVAGHPLIAPDRGQGLQEAVPCDIHFPKDGFHLFVGVLDQSQEKMFHRDILVSHLLGFILRMDQGVVQVLAYILAASLDLGPFSYGLFRPVDDQVLVDPHLLHQLQDQAVVLSEERVEQMLLLDLLVAVLHGDLLTVLNRLERFLRKFIYVHNIVLLYRVMA